MPPTSWGTTAIPALDLRILNWESGSLRLRSFDLKVGRLGSLCQYDKLTPAPMLAFSTGPFWRFLISGELLFRL